MCKMLISPGIFSFFQDFDFWGFQGVKRAKNDQKLPISVCHALDLKNRRSYHRDFCYTGVKQVFFSTFFKM